MVSFRGQIRRDLLEHFHVRAGYAKPAEPFEEAIVEQAFQSDLSVAAE